MENSIAMARQPGNNGIRILWSSIKGGVYCQACEKRFTGNHFLFIFQFSLRVLLILFFFFFNCLLQLAFSIAIQLRPRLVFAIFTEDCCVGIITKYNKRPLKGLRGKSAQY